MLFPSGLSPISARKFANENHRSHTVIPRPPYLGYADLFFSLQRVIIPIQPVNVGVSFPPLADPCLIGWLFAHPQLLVPLVIRLPTLTGLDFPHVHLHKTIAPNAPHAYLLDGSTSMTVQWLNVLPIKYFLGFGCII